MSRKRSKRKVASGEQHAEIVTGPEAANAREASVDSLPNETLLLILAKLAFPSKQNAAMVCRRWHDLLLEPSFCRHLGRGQSLSEALQQCTSGDTLIVPPGMYQETLLVQQPVKLISQDLWTRTRAHLRALRHGNPAGGPDAAIAAAAAVVTGPSVNAGAAAAAAAAPAAAAAAVAAAQAGQAAGPAAGGRARPVGRGAGRCPGSQAGGSSAGGSGLAPQPGPSSGTQPLWAQERQSRRQRAQQAETALEAGGGSRAAAAAGSLGGGGAVLGAAVDRAPAPSVTVITLRPPVVVMNSRCCFVGFEFHTATAHNEVSICCFGPDAPVARFERCTFSGLTGLRVPYSKGSHTRLELYDCTLIGTTQTLAAVQMDAGQLVLMRCVVQNNAVGVEVGPEALARLERCEVRWCGTALVVDGFLAMAHCRLWGNAKVGNVNTDARLRAAQSHSLACLAVQGGGRMQQSQQKPTGRTDWSAVFPRRNRGGRTAEAGTADTGIMDTAAPASTSAAGGCSGGAAADPTAAPSPAMVVASAPNPAVTAAAVLQPGADVGRQWDTEPARVAALAAAQWSEVRAVFLARQQQLVRVVDCEVSAPQLILRTGLHKEVRKKARQLVRQVFGAPDVDNFPEWEVLVHSDLDSDLDEEDSSVNVSGSGLEDEDSDFELDEEGGEGEDPLDAADDPDLDESGGSSFGSGSVSSGTAYAPGVPTRYKKVQEDTRLEEGTRKALHGHVLSRVLTC